MENESSNKIRLLLNELAILNQPEKHEGKFIYHLDTLQRIKQLSAELYLLADNSMFGSSSNTQLPTEKAGVLQNQTVSPPIETMNEIVAMPEIENVTVEPVIIEKIAEEMPPMEIKEPALKPASASLKADEISAKISITRRFEYTNKLFGADAHAFNNFLADIAEAGSLEKSMEKFDAIYVSQNWKRNSETASDLKQLLRKMLF